MLRHARHRIHEEFLWEVRLARSLRKDAHALAVRDGEQHLDIVVVHVLLFTEAGFHRGPMLGPGLQFQKQDEDEGSRGQADVPSDLVRWEEGDIHRSWK